MYTLNDYADCDSKVRLDRPGSYGLQVPILWKDSLPRFTEQSGKQGRRKEVTLF